MLKLVKIGTCWSSDGAVVKGYWVAADQPLSATSASHRATPSLPFKFASSLLGHHRDESRLWDGPGPATGARSLRRSTRRWAAAGACEAMQLPLADPPLSKRKPVLEEVTSN
jgi:hypothetical protein